MNSITAAELKRRGMAAIEEGLRRGPVHLVKRNRLSAVVLSADEYARLVPKRNKKPAGMTAIQWLLAQRTTGKRRKRQIDKSLRDERKSWV
jgi:PHD/YefM family antitoxin component YafN of YafNO toxin-antitoxin module